MGRSIPFNYGCLLEISGRKREKLYAIFDAFAQNNGQMNVSNERYLNAIKLFLTAVTPLEYQAYQGYAHVGRQFSGIGARIASQMQSIDELRHVQTQIHAMSHYNKFFDGFQDWAHMHDRVWYLSVPKSFLKMPVLLALSNFY